MRIKIKEHAYYIFIFLIMIYYGFRRTRLDYSVFNIFMYLSIPFFMIKLCMEKYSLREAVRIAACLLWGVITAYLADDTSILIGMCVMVGMKGIRVKNPLKIVFGVRMLVTAIVMFLVQFGFVEDRVITRSGNSAIVRRAMGYQHPNTMGIYCFVLITLWFLLDNRVGVKLKVLVGSMAGISVYCLTNSRMSLLGILFFLVLCVCSEKMKITSLKKIATGVTLFMAAVNIIAPLFYNGAGIMALVNRILNSRLSLGSSFLRVYGIHLTGQKIASIVDPSSYWYLDSGWLNILLKFGLISYVFFLVMIIKVYKITDSKIVICILIAMVTYGSVEDILSSMLYNYVWILFGAVFFYKGNNRNLKINLKVTWK